jgi:hypothetical protein
MKVRTTITGTAFRAKLTALCWGALTLVAPVAISACSGSTTTPTVPTFSPSVTVSGTVTAPPSGGNTASSGVTPSSTDTTASGTPTPTPTVTRTVTAPATSSTSEVPTAAPVTGGGGTAGFQDTLLLGLGAAAILAGIGSIVYRRRLSRDR